MRGMMGWKTAAVLGAATAWGAAGSAAKADVKLPPVVSENMVVQRDMPAPIWGTATPGEEVSVEFRDQVKKATADAQGKWMVKLDPLKAGGPDVMTVQGKNQIKLNDVLVGEVWIGSGQSNMAGGTAGYAKNDPVLAEMAAKNYPQLRLLKSKSNGWVKADPAGNNAHSALLLSFGVPLQKELDVPVGLMLGAVGGTPSGYWLSQQAFAADKECQQAVARAAKTFDREAMQKKYEQDLIVWEKASADAKAAGKPAPRKPEPPLEPGQGRQPVGHLFETHIRPYMPFAVRGVLWDQGESGPGVAGVGQYEMMAALIRGWRQEWNQGEFPFLYVQKPSGGGCAWDYDASTTRLAERFTALPPRPPLAQEGAQRDIYTQLLKVPGTGLVTASDLGSGIHPLNKSGYGARAARVALGLVYRKPVEIYGPLYASHKVEGSKVRVSFTHVGQGLAFRHSGNLQGFAVAGADKVFHWASAEISGPTVLVSSDKVPEPVAVRYAWGRTHPWSNLFNADTLPALPFRTDSW